MRDREVNMRRLLIAIIMLGAVLWAVEPWTGVCGPVPWWVKDSGVIGRFRGICVISDSLVWVVGENGAVYKRTGGVHSHQWESVSVPGASAYHFNDVCFVNPSVGWIVGEKKAEPNRYKGVVYKTTDGGVHWDSIIPLSVPPNLPTPFLKVKFANLDYGYISCGNGIVLATTNGGNTWRRCKTPWDNPSHPGDSISVWYNGLWVDPNSPNNLWVSGDAFGVVSKSMDGGATWTTYQPSAFDWPDYQFPPPTGTPYGTKLANFDIEFTDANHGIVGLSFGRVGKTADGGATWTVHQYEPQPTWFYDVANIGTNNFAGGNYGVIHRFDGADEQEHVNYRWVGDNYTTDFSALDGRTSSYAYGAGSGTGSVRQRYDPGDFSNLSVVIQNDTITRRYWIIISWHSSIFDGFRYWSVERYCGSYLLNKCDWGSWLIYENTGAVVCSTYIGYWQPRLDYYYAIKLGIDDGHQYCAVVKIDSAELDSCSTWVAPQAPANVHAQDVADDQGFQIKITWDIVSGVYYYYVGRSTSPDGPYYMIGRVVYPCDSFIDKNAQNRTPYYYVLTSERDPSSNYSNPTSAFALDNLTPDTVRNVQGVYLPGDSLIKIIWNPPSGATDIAGYWVCPEYPDGMRYRLAHSSPVERLVYYWPISPPLPESAGIAVAAMDYSGHISNWVLKYVQLRPSVAITNDPAATGLNNSPKLVYDAVRGLLHLVYSDNNSILYRNSNGGGISWSNEVNLGDGFYPALTKDQNNELHCVWVNLSPPLPQSDPTQPDTFYVPLPEYTWYLKYRCTQNGIWQEDSAFTIDDFTKSPAIPMSMHFSAPSITTTQDSVHIFMEKTIYYYYPPGWYWLLCYYTFPKNHPEMLSCSVIDSAFEYVPPPPLAYPESLINISDPSCVADRYDVLHVAYAICSNIRYQCKDGATWSGSQVISPIGIYDQPSIGINLDEIMVVWSGNPIPGPGSQILCRRKFINSAAWGNVERLDKGNNLSVFPICLNNQVLWCEEVDETNFEIYYSRLSGYAWTSPENLSNTLRKSILPQAAFYRGPRQSTLYYLFTDGNEAPYYLFTGKKVFSTDEIPIYAVDLGGESPSSTTIQRDGYLVYGEDPWMTVDYDSTQLVYSLTGLEPTEKYEIEWDWYHQSNQCWHERLRIDNIFNEHKWVPPGERVTIRKPVPKAVFQDGIMEITNEITDGNGLAVLSGFAILDAAESGGGPQGEEALISEPFFWEWIYPNPTKGAIRIRFNSPDERSVSVKLYDVCGRLVHKQSLLKSKTGVNELLITRQNSSAGVYFVQVDAGDYRKVEKAVQLR